MRADLFARAGHKNATERKLRKADQFRRLLGDAFSIAVGEKPSVRPTNSELDRFSQLPCQFLTGSLCKEKPTGPLSSAAINPWEKFGLTRARRPVEPISLAWCDGLRKRPSWRDYLIL